LPQQEGINRVQGALANLKGRDKRDQMFSLGYFHTPVALDWIEQNIFEPITEAWGYLAAASKIDWRRIEFWLNRGRPLSHVAIDALMAIAQPRGAILRAYRPVLVEPPNLANFRLALTAYRERDPVPRVRNRIERLLATGEILAANDKG
jgi:hypothetical protein